MVSRINLHFKVTDRSFFAIIKKDIHALAASAGFSEGKIGQIDIVVAEIVSNLVKHASNGQLLVRLFTSEKKQGIELISIDDGPGMSDITRMVADGVSTTNTLGHGLGTMKRMSDVFQVFSQKGWGTVILLRILEEAPGYVLRPTTAEIGQVIIAKPGEASCGDAFFHLRQTGCIKFFLCDGLGHGVEAEAAALKAGEVFLSCRQDDPVDIIRTLHSGVKKTRGLVGTVAVFDLRQQYWRICGVGNITTKFNGPSFSKNYLPYNGIIGLNIPNSLNSQEVRYEKGQLLLMCSDGLKSRWDTSLYPSIHRYDPALISATLFKDFNRHSDDVSIATCKINLR